MLLEKASEMYSDVVDGGDSFGKVAYKYGTTKAKVKDILYDYKPYTDWLKKMRSNENHLKSQILMYMGKGKSVEFLSEHYQMEKEAIERYVSEINRRSSSQITYDVPGQRAVSITDVRRFARFTEVGDLLTCGITKDGLLIKCKVLKKYPHFAMTDLGTFDWNWLCVKNIENATLEYESEGDE